MNLRYQINNYYIVLLLTLLTIHTLEGMQFSPDHKGEYPASDLIIAIKKGDQSTVQRILSEKKNSILESNFYTIQAARECKTNRVGMLKLLLENKINIHDTYQHKDNLETAIFTKEIDTPWVIMLIKNGAFLSSEKIINNNTFWTPNPLVYALKNQNLHLFNLLLDKNLHFFQSNSFISFSLIKQIYALQNQNERERILNSAIKKSEPFNQKIEIDIRYVLTDSFSETICLESGRIRLKQDITKGSSDYNWVELLLKNKVDPNNVLTGNSNTLNELIIFQPQNPHLFSLLLKYNLNCDMAIFYLNQWCRNYPTSDNLLSYGGSIIQQRWKKVVSSQKAIALIFLLLQCTSGSTLYKITKGLLKNLGKQYWWPDIHTNSHTFFEKNYAEAYPMLKKFIPNFNLSCIPLKKEPYLTFNEVPLALDEYKDRLLDKKK